MSVDYMARTDYLIDHDVRGVLGYDKWTARDSDRLDRAIEAMRIDGETVRPIVFDPLVADALRAETAERRCQGDCNRVLVIVGTDKIRQPLPDPETHAYHKGREMCGPCYERMRPGIPHSRRRQRSLTDDQETRVDELLHEGHTDTAIARVVGCSRATIYARRKAYEQQPDAHVRQVYNSGRAITPERFEQIAEMLRRGEQVRTIQAALKCGAMTIAKVRKALADQDSTPSTEQVAS